MLLVRNILQQNNDILHAIRGGETLLFLSLKIPKCNPVTPTRYPEKREMEPKSKKWVNGGLMAICLLIVYAFSSSRDVANTISIEDAIKTGTIQVTMIANGGFSENSVALKIINKSADDLQLIVNAGSVFYSTDPGEQELVVPIDQLILVKARAQMHEQLSAYCTEANDKVPQEKGPMTMKTSSNKKLLALTSYLNKNKVSPDTYQDAIWSVTDQHSLSNIVVSKKEDRELRTFLANLTGMKDTWYSSPQERVVRIDRQIVQETVTINGELSFKTTVGAVVHQEIHKKDTGLLFKSEKRNTIKTGNVDYSFFIKVRGWEKGEYEVRVMEGATLIASYPFVI
jgi:hypothetical protein